MGTTTGTIDEKHCRTHRVFGTDVYWCLACKSDQQQCQYALSFGYSFMCRHPARSEFVERAVAGPSR